MLKRIAKLLGAPRLNWLWEPELLLEIFVTMNLAILAGDIVLAHSVNNFRNPAEYVPLYFSADAPLLLLLGMVAGRRYKSREAWRSIGLLVGGLSVLVGLAGVVYHLESSFFRDRTLHSLTYAAPFAAPLAYAGLGFLLLLNRLVLPGDAGERRQLWARWVMLMAAGGFFGNFVLSLADHAGNGFFLKTEWIPVISSALATGFLLVPVLEKVSRRFLDWALIVMLMQAAVGVLGFLLHLEMNIKTPGTTWFERTVYGAPPMAPLLFPNLVGLALIGMAVQAASLPADAERPGLWDRLIQWAEPLYQSSVQPRVKG